MKSKLAPRRLGTLFVCVPVLFAAFTGRSETATPPTSPESSSPPSRQKIEIKLVVPAGRVARTSKSLKLDGRPARKVEICFFDTADSALAAGGLILRVRQKSDGPDDSTVKLRTADRAADLSAFERSLKPEEDWTNRKQPVISHSLDQSDLPTDLVRGVIDGRAAARILFDARQRKLVAARVPDFKWSSLRRYGPIEAEVWPRQFLLDGFPQPVTVERWRMKKAGRTVETLEVSATAKAGSADEAARLAQSFFDAAAAAGFGKPSGRTKTESIHDFFKPGD